MNSPDPRLKDLFDERGQGVNVTGDLAERAIARDRRNRRREVAAIAAGAALALAVALPVTWNVLGSNRAGQVPASPSHTVSSLPPTPTTPTTPPPTTPVAAPTVTATSAPDAVSLRPADGAVTGTTDLGYVVDGVYHEGSTTIPLPDKNSGWLAARLADGLVVGAASPNGDGVFWVLDGSGRRLAVLPLGDKVVVSADHTHFLASDQEGNLTYHDAAGKKLDELMAASCECQVQGMPSGFRAVGLDGDVAYAVKGSTGRTAVWDLRTGRVTQLTREVVAVDTAGQRALVRASAPDDPICHELVDLGSGATVWRLCAPLLFDAAAFAPDGSHLVGTGLVDGLSHDQLRGDGSFRFEPVVVVDASDGAIVVQGAGTPGNSRLSTAGLVVQVSSSQGTRNLQQCSLTDGSCVVVAPAKKLADPTAPELVGPYILSVN